MAQLLGGGKVVPMGRGNILRLRLGSSISTHVPLSKTTTQPDTAT